MMVENQQRKIVGGSAEASPTPSSGPSNSKLHLSTCVPVRHKDRGAGYHSEPDPALQQKDQSDWDSGLIELATAPSLSLPTSSSPWVCLGDQSFKIHQSKLHNEPKSKSQSRSCTKENLALPCRALALGDPMLIPCPPRRRALSFVETCLDTMGRLNVGALLVR